MAAAPAPDPEAREAGVPADHVCFDFRVRSLHPLSALAQATPEHRDLPLVEIRWGHVPESLLGARGSPESGLQAVGETALLTIPGVARYLVCEGREIVVDPAGGASPRDVRLFLLGSAIGILCFQRGLLPIHANAIALNGAAVAFAGRSGSGKSTLAAFFARRGHSVLSDDLCMIRFGASGPIAWPGLPRLKLWSDAAAAFGFAVDGLEPVRDDLDKYELAVEAPSTVAPLPLRRLYVLARCDPGEPASIRKLAGMEAMAAVLSQTYRARYLETLGLQARQFEQAAELLRHVSVYSARRPWGYDGFEAEALRLAHHAASH